MAGILVVSQAVGVALHPATPDIFAIASRLARSRDEQVVGTLAGDWAEGHTESLRRVGFSEVILPTPSRDAVLGVDRQVAALNAIADDVDPRLILAPHTLDTAEWLPLLAGRRGAAVVTDCRDLTESDGCLLAVKMVCGGALAAEYELNGHTAVATLGPEIGAAFPAALPCPVRSVAVPDVTERATVIEETHFAVSDGPTLKQASTIVAGGLGVGRESWRLITDAAVVLGAAVGATRAVIESGWAPYSQQVGYSGTKVSPNLYIAIGISGAVHHLVGISQAKTVVAINSDPTAEIFKVSRFGVVGDAKLVVPAFVERLRELRGH